MISSSAAAIPRMITHFKCKCGAEYNRTDTKFLVTHKGDAICEACGAVLESWDSTHVPSFKRIKTQSAERASERRVWAP